MKNKENLLKKIKIFCNKKIIPILKLHKGGFKIIDIDKNKNLIIEFTNKCKSCLTNKLTLNNIIKKKIFKEFIEIKNIIIKQK